MGRFYSGDIEGKFWFGVQDSNDIENLVNITPDIEYAWKVCNCFAEIDDEDYCSCCYDTKEDHINEAIDEEEYDNEGEDKLYYEAGSIGYSLDKETHYDNLLDNMNKLKTQIGEEIIKEFDKIEQNDDVMNTFTGVFDKPILFINNMKEQKKRKKLDVLVARYTLGYQIEYCLRTNDSCNVNCEI